MEEYFGFEPDEIAEKNGKPSGFKQFRKKFPKSQEEKVAVRKEIRKKKQERKKRLIIRNLSFKVNEEELKNEFCKFGDVVDVNIPKKPDGKMRGFAFVQYKTFQSAIEAVRNLNYQKLKGRPIAVDYAVAKDKYQHITSSKHTTNNPCKEPKEDIEKESEDIEKESEDIEKESEETEGEVEKTDSDDGDDSKNDVRGNSEEESVSDTADDHVKKFLKEFNADQESLPDATVESEESCSESGSSSENDDSSHFRRLQNAKERGKKDEDDLDDLSDSETETDTLKKRKRKASEVSGEEPLNKKKNHSHDINEGKTVFIRNVSFDTDQDALKSTMETFGPVKYCLLVIDQFTELPRGTAFVKFEHKEDAEKVIQKSSESDSDGIYLDGRKLCCTLALSKEELQSRTDSGTKTRKDKRNLCLLKVGVIMKDSVEAEGVSQSDLTKRSKLEMFKKNKLKNLQFFVSDKRLCVHNIPSYYNDAELRKLFKNAAGPGAKITEAKIMRNFKKVTAQGIAQSKGFGFVAFEKHDDALKALKAINNNPDVFTPQQRPIVEFSVENTNALLMKKRRKERNILKSKKDTENLKADGPEEENITSLKFNKKINVGKKNEAGKKIQGKTNSNKNHWRTKTELKKDKMENKLNRERKPSQIMKKKHANNSSVKETPEKKKNKKWQQKNKASSSGIGKDNFNQMVDKYKQKLLSKM